MKRNIICKKYAKILASIVGIFLFVVLVFSTHTFAASYSSDYRYWDQGASDDSDMRSYGCWVTAQAKLLYASGIQTSPEFNPDVYLAWERANGQIDRNFYQTSTWYAPVLYASQVGVELEYLGEWNASADQIWFNINAGYHTIVKVNNGGHYVYVDNDYSKNTGQIYVDDSSPGCPRLLSNYGIWNCGYVYRIKTIEPTEVQNLGDNFNAFLKSENGFYNADRNSDIVLENYSCDSKLVWNFVRQADNTYIIKNVGTGLYLDIYNSNNNNGGRIWTFSYNGSSAQRYYIYGNENGYILRPQCLPNKVVTVNNGSNSLGNKLNVWQYYYDCKTQLFKIQKVNLDESIKTSSYLPFTDVPEGMWYSDAVKYVYQNNIIKGYNATTYAPQDKLTRGMMVNILYRMEGSPNNDGKSKFTDVNSKDWYAKAVKWAVSKGIVSGYGGTTKFGPKDNIKRQDLVAILRNYAKYKNKNTNINTDLTKYKDYKKIDDYAKASMQWAVGKGVVTGNSSNMLNPKGTATRAEVAALIQKYCYKVGR